MTEMSMQMAMRVSAEIRLYRVATVTKYFPRWQWDIACFVKRSAKEARIIQWEKSVHMGMA
jgi:hypothetical protein